MEPSASPSSWDGQEPFRKRQHFSRLKIPAASVGKTCAVENLDTLYPTGLLEELQATLLQRLSVLPQLDNDDDDHSPSPVQGTEGNFNPSGTWAFSETWMHDATSTLLLFHSVLEKLYRAWSAFHTDNILPQLESLLEPCTTQIALIHVLDELSRFRLTAHYLGPVIVVDLLHLASVAPILYRHSIHLVLQSICRSSLSYIFLCLPPCLFGSDTGVKRLRRSLLEVLLGNGSHSGGDEQSSWKAIVFLLHSVKQRLLLLRLRPDVPLTRVDDRLVQFVTIEFTKPRDPSVTQGQLQDRFRSVPFEVQSILQQIVEESSGIARFAETQPSLTPRGRNSPRLTSPRAERSSRTPRFATVETTKASSKSPSPSSPGRMNPPLRTLSSTRSPSKADDRSLSPSSRPIVPRISTQRLQGVVGKDRVATARQESSRTGRLGTWSRRGIAVAETPRTPATTAAKKVPPPAVSAASPTPRSARLLFPDRALPPTSRGASPRSVAAQEAALALPLTPRGSPSRSLETQYVSDMTVLHKQGDVSFWKLLYGTPTSNVPGKSTPRFPGNLAQKKTAVAASSSQGPQLLESCLNSLQRAEERAIELKIIGSGRAEYLRDHWETRRKRLALQTHLEELGTQEAASRDLIESLEKAEREQQAGRAQRSLATLSADQDSRLQVETTLRFLSDNEDASRQDLATAFLLGLTEIQEAAIVSKAESRRSESARIVSEEVSRKIRILVEEAAPKEIRAVEQEEASAWTDEILLPFFEGMTSLLIAEECTIRGRVENHWEEEWSLLEQIACEELDQLESDLALQSPLVSPRSRQPEIDLNETDGDFGEDLADLLFRHLQDELFEEFDFADNFPMLLSDGYLFTLSIDELRAKILQCCGSVPADMRDRLADYLLALVLWRKEVLRIRTFSPLGPHQPDDWTLWQQYSRKDKREGRPASLKEISGKASRAGLKSMSLYNPEVGRDGLAVLRAGTLWKKVSDGKRWDERYGVVYSHFLYYFKKMDGREPCAGVLCLYGCRVMVLSPSEAEKVGKEHVVLVKCSCPRRPEDVSTFHFAFAEEKDLRIWVKWIEVESLPPRPKRPWLKDDKESVKELLKKSGAQGDSDDEEDQSTVPETGTAGASMSASQQSQLGSVKDVTNANQKTHRIHYANQKEISMCPGCKKNFNFRRHRHHCKSCGEVFCDSCAPKVKGTRTCIKCLNGVTNTSFISNMSLISAPSLAGTLRANGGDANDPLADTGYYSRYFALQGEGDSEESDPPAATQHQP
jgi:hypothetical protein